MGVKCMFCGEGELEQIDKDIEFATGTISDLKLAAYVEGRKSNFPQELVGGGTIKLHTINQLGAINVALCFQENLSNHSKRVLENIDFSAF